MQPQRRARPVELLVTKVTYVFARANELRLVITLPVREVMEKTVVILPVAGHVELKQSTNNNKPDKRIADALGRVVQRRKRA